MNNFLVFLLGCCFASFYYWLAANVPKRGEGCSKPVTLSASCFLYQLFGGWILTVLVHNYQYSAPQLIFCGALYSVLFLVAAVDQHYMIIPDRLQVFLAGLFIVFHWHNGTLLMWQFYLSAVVMLLVSLLATSTIEDGLGGGDIKLLILFGYGLGFTQASWVLFTASLLALFYMGSQLLIRKRALSSPIPFGPFLVIAFFLVREVW